jgi:hypothetical protein
MIVKKSRNSIVLATIIAATLGTMPYTAHAAPADCATQKGAGQPCVPDASAPVAPAATPPAAATPSAVATPPAAVTPPAATPPATPPAAANPPSATPPAAANPPVASRRQQASGFQFDPNRHNRRNQRNDLFRFFFNGYYYDRPYWQQGQYEPRYSRVSCGEGRRILADDDFTKISTIECNGPTYTYKANRSGRTYRVSVDARRGTISGRSRIY